MRVDGHAVVVGHLAILAITGSGKTWTARRIIEELSQKALPILEQEPDEVLSIVEALKDEVKRALDSVSHANEEAGQRSIAERNTRFLEAEVARRKRSSADLADGTQSIYLADMGGDGLTDLVRIRNGEVCFGAKVTMDQSPRSTTKLTTQNKA